MSQTVVITGANRGLGLEFVRQLLAQPQPPESIIATCRKPSTELLAISKANPTVYVVKLDVRNFDSYANFELKVRDIVGHHGLQLLINNAGILVDVSMT